VNDWKYLLKKKKIKVNDWKYNAYKFYICSMMYGIDFNIEPSEYLETWNFNSVSMVLVFVS